MERIVFSNQLPKYVKWMSTLGIGQLHLSLLSSSFYVYQAGMPALTMAGLEPLAMAASAVSLSASAYLMTSYHVEKHVFKITSFDKQHKQNSKVRLFVGYWSFQKELIANVKGCVYDFMYENGHDIIGIESIGKSSRVHEFRIGPQTFMLNMDGKPTLDEAEYKRIFTKMNKKL